MKLNVIHVIGWTLLIIAMAATYSAHEFDDMTEDVDRKEVTGRWK